MAEKCERCGKPPKWLDPFPDGKICSKCWAAERPQREAEAAIQKQAREQAEAEEQAHALIERERVADTAPRILLTTETAPNLPIARRIDIVTAEVVIGMHLFKDVAGVFRDVFGGRSKTMQSGLRDARKLALDELRIEAASLGADAVVGVDLDYSEISGGGKSMLFLVASGTAVTLAGGG